MALLHVSDLTKSMTETPDVVIDCNSGHEMSKEIFSVKSFTEENTSSDVVWDSAHYRIMLWFNNKELATLYSIQR